MGRGKRWTVRDDGRRVDGCCAEGEGKAHQRGIELRIPCEDHRGIRSQRLARFVHSRDVRITGFRAHRVHLVYFDGRRPPVSQDAEPRRTSLPLLRDWRTLMYQRVQRTLEKRESRRGSSFSHSNSNTGSFLFFFLPSFPLPDLPFLSLNLNRRSLILLSRSFVLTILFLLFSCPSKHRPFSLLFSFFA